MLRKLFSLAICCTVAMAMFTPAEGGGCRPIKRKAHSPNDPIDFIAEAIVVGDCLELSVQASGGCETHRMQLTWDGEVAESFPPQVNLVIHYDSQEDPCDGLVLTTERFRLKRVQLRGYDTVLLNIHGSNGQVVQVPYSY